MQEDTGVPTSATGTLVLNLVDSEGPLFNFQDLENNPPGIAITSINEDIGRFYYTTDELHWHEIKSASESNAILLQANNTTRVALQPLPNLVDIVDNAITFKAWDGTTFISYSNNPSTINSINTDTTIEGISLSTDGQKAFIAEGNDGISILDISNPGNESIITSHNGGYFAKDVAVSNDGSYAFVAAGTNGLKILDTRAENNISIIGEYQTTGSTNYVILSNDGQKIFVIDDSEGLVILNINDISNPILHGQLDTEGVSQKAAISANEELIFIADGENGLAIINIADSKIPYLLSTVDEDK